LKVVAYRLLAIAAPVRGLCARPLDFRRFEPPARGLLPVAPLAGAAALPALEAIKLANSLRKAT
jgi:hypothetical protein